jgi:hypothetical protein
VAWWARAEAVRRKAGIRWTPALPAGEVDGLTIVPLDSAIALWEEGVRMRHCLGAEHYIQDARRGAFDLIAVRDTRGRSVATAEIGSTLFPGGKRWYVREIRGPMNRQVDGGVEAALDRYLEDLTIAGCRRADDGEAPSGFSARCQSPSPFWIHLELDVQARGDGEVAPWREGVVLEFDDAFGGLETFFDMLRGIAAGAHRLSCAWDNARADFEVEVAANRLQVRMWAKRNGREYLACSVPKAEFVATIYCALRAFVESAAVPQEGCWQWSLGARLAHLFDGALDVPDFERLLSTRDRDTNVDVATRLFALDRLPLHGIHELTLAVRGEPMPLMPPDLHAQALFPSRFDAMPDALRRDIVARALQCPADDRPAMCWMVSPRIEQWLQDKGIDVAAALRHAAAANTEGECIDPGRWQPSDAGISASGDAPASADTTPAWGGGITDDAEEPEGMEVPAEGACPICGDDCECEHLLVSIDDSDGPLYGRFQSACEALVATVRDWMFTAIVGGGGELIGDALDAALGDVAKARFSWRLAAAEADPDIARALDPETARPAFDALFDELGLQQRIWEWIGDTLADLPQVEVQHFEMSNAPGLSWCGRTFYARADADGVMARAIERLQARLA